MARFNISRASTQRDVMVNPCEEAFRNVGGWFVEFKTIEDFEKFAEKYKRLTVGPSYIQIDDTEW